MEAFGITWGWSNSKNGRRWDAPRWERSAGLDDDGGVWLPAAVVGNEALVYAKTDLDGEPLVLHDDHLFVRVSWLRREYPECAEGLDALAAKIRAAFEGFDPAAHWRRPKHYRPAHPAAR